MALRSKQSDAAQGTNPGIGDFVADFAEGQVIAGKYRLETKLGEGGMGSVWLALNFDLQTRVAIKLIRRDIQYAGAAHRLLREARAAAQLHHPAISRIFDFGLTEESDPYIVMEYLEGRTLAQVLREEKLTAEEAVGLLLPAAAGLLAAHRRGMIHRDFKPDNVILSEPDTGGLQPVILDFGIVKLMGPAPSPALTRSGPVGTPAYMSPEQIVEDDIDVRADIWSFCVVLYEALSHSMLFGGDAGKDTFASVLQDPIRSLVGHGSVDEALWSILERGLRRDREERWSSFEQLGEALSLWLMDRGIGEDITGTSFHGVWLGRVSSINPSGDLRSRPSLSRITPVAGVASAASRLSTASAGASEARPMPAFYWHSMPPASRTGASLPAAPVAPAPSRRAGRAFRLVGGAASLALAAILAMSLGERSLSSSPVRALSGVRGAVPRFEPTPPAQVAPVSPPVTPSPAAAVRPSATAPAPQVSARSGSASSSKWAGNPDFGF